VVSLKSRPLYTMGKSSGNLLRKRLDDVHSRSGRFGEENCLVCARELNHGSPVIRPVAWSPCDVQFLTCFGRIFRG
jgi:hypothetical protein